jgi:hypothetical protein
MINLREQVPVIYSAASRDFQYLGWLIDIVLNSVKHNIDDLYYLPNVQSNTKFAELLATTLGFKIKRRYDQKQLAALVSILPSILKCKGTEKAVLIAGYALIKASGSPGEPKCKLDNKGNLEIILPKELIDVSLFSDLLPYILPGGMTCRIVRKTQASKTLRTEVSYDDRLVAHAHEELQWLKDENKQSGLASMFEYKQDQSGYVVIPPFTNYETVDNGGQKTEVLITGLMDNTVIPTLSANDSKYFAQLDHPLYATEESKAQKEENNDEK